MLHNLLVILGLLCDNVMCIERAGTNRAPTAPLHSARSASVPHEREKDADLYRNWPVSCPPLKM